MKIKLKIISYLIYHVGFSERELEFPKSITVEELLIGINLKKRFPILIIRNGESLNASEKLKNGDRIIIAPFFSGG